MYDLLIAAHHGASLLFSKRPTPYSTLRASLAAITTAFCSAIATSRNLHCRVPPRHSALHAPAWQLRSTVIGKYINNRLTLIRNLPCNREQLLCSFSISSRNTCTGLSNGTFFSLLTHITALERSICWE